MSTGKKLVSNVFFLSMDWVSVAVLGFIFWIMAGKLLLPGELGIVSTVTNFVGIISSVCIVGLDVAMVKLVSEYLQRKGIKKVNWLVSFSSKTVLSISLAAAAAILALSGQLSSFLNVPLEAVWISSAILIFFTFQQFFGNILLGVQNMKWVALTNFFGHLGKVILALLLVFIGFGYFGFLTGFLFGMLAIALLRMSSIKLRGAKQPMEKRHLMKKFAFPAFVSAMAWVLFLNGQYVILSALKGTEATGVFTVAVLLTLPITVIPHVMTKAVLPIISQLCAEGDSRKLQSYLITHVLRYVLFVSIPLAMFLIPFSRHVILIVSRPEYLAASVLFPVLALASIVFGFGQILNNSLYGIGKTEAQRNIVILTTAVFLAVAVPLTQLFSYFGIVAGYTIAVTVFFLASFFKIRKLIKIQLFPRSILKMLISGAVSLGVIFLLASVLEGLIWAVPVLIIATAIYLFILLFTGFYREEDVRILEMFSQKTPVMKRQVKGLGRFLSRRVNRG